MKGAIIIFTNFFSLVFDVLKTSINRFCKSGRRVKASAFAVVAVIAMVFGLISTDAQIAYNVNYNGKRIATVKSKQHFAAAVSLVLEMVDGEHVEDIISEPDFSVVLAQSENVEDSKAVASHIIENSEEITAAATLIVDGQKVACVDESLLNKCIEQRLSEFDFEGSSCTSEFVNDVVVESGYYLTENVDDISIVQQVVSQLDVRTTGTVTNDISVGYSTKIEKNGEKLVGEKSVKVEGKEGITRITQNVVAINGNIVSTQEVSKEILQPAVTEVIEVGTAKSAASARLNQQANSAGFIFPLPASSWRLGAYYGDGRNHKGVDLCASKGTAIYAVSGGKVVHASTKSGYGYCVIIDHGNGIQTLYAHASALCVNVGQTVNAGDVVALVGSTGNSSGNHLHFEVKVGGKNVDPKPFINLR